MKAVVQRVSRAAVSVGGEVIGRIADGFLVLVGVGAADTEEDAAALAAKIAVLRIFSDSAGQMNLSLLDIGGAALVISQFTLYGDARKGRRPSFAAAGPPEIAERLVDHFARHLEAQGVHVERGRFGAKMAIELVNDGPVTLILETRNGKLVRSASTSSINS